MFPQCSRGNIRARFGGLTRADSGDAGRFAQVAGTSQVRGGVASGSSPALGTLLPTLRNPW